MVIKTGSSGKLSNLYIFLNRYFFKEDNKNKKLFSFCVKYDGHVHEIHLDANDSFIQSISQSLHVHKKRSGERGITADYELQPLKRRRLTHPISPRSEVTVQSFISYETPHNSSDLDAPSLDSRGSLCNTWSGIGETL